MKYLFGLLAMVIISSIQSSTIGQSNSIDITPDTSVQPYSFPYSLYCSEIEAPHKGTVWNNITIGTSTKEDLESLMSQFNEGYHSVQLGDEFAFDISPKVALKMHIPSVVIACVRDNKILALQFTNTEAASYVTINDIVSENGLPDIVTWTDEPSIRVAFWFDKGLAAEVNIHVKAVGLNYGQVVRTTHFPFQNKVGYEKRWPYNATRIDAPSEYTIYDPPLSKAQNPFNFEAIIATITAEPSRTPTPTIIPLSPPITVTVTP